MKSTFDVIPEECIEQHNNELNDELLENIHNMVQECIDREAEEQANIALYGEPKGETKTHAINELPF